MPFADITIFTKNTRQEANRVRNSHKLISWWLNELRLESKAFLFQKL